MKWTIDLIDSPLTILERLEIQKKMFGINVLTEDGAEVVSLWILIHLSITNSGSRRQLVTAKANVSMPLQGSSFQLNVQSMSRACLRMLLGKLSSEFLLLS